jgi:hypothetical protein
MRFIAGIVLGLSLGAGSMIMFAQNERAMHPRLATAIAALRDARAYMFQAPHDFGGHKEAAIRATDEAIRQLEFALRYRPRRPQVKIKLPAVSYQPSRPSARISGSGLAGLSPSPFGRTASSR